MLNVSSLLQRGNLTAKERVRIIISDTINKDKGEKEILSKADKHALTKGWQGSDYEIEEYNKYIKGWNFALYAELDAQTCYLNAKLAFQTSTYLLKDFSLYPSYREVRRALDSLKKIKTVNYDELSEIVKRAKQYKLDEGQAFEYTMLKLAFEITDDKTKQEISDISDDGLENFLDNELELSELYKAKDYETIAENASKEVYNNMTKEYTLCLHYAGISIYDIAEQYAKENKLSFTKTRQDKTDETIDFTDEKLSKEIRAKAFKEQSEQAGKRIKDQDLLIKIIVEHAKKNKTTPETIIKTTCLQMLKEGAFNDCIGIYDTKLFDKWTDAKKKAKEILQDLIKRNELKTATNKENETILTGESLYNSKESYKFIADFKNYINDYLPYGAFKDDKGEVLDIELLLTDGASRFKMDLMNAEYLQTLSIIKETEENGKKFIDIDNKEWKKMFMTGKNTLIERYEQLLGFDDLFTRLSKVYGIELGDKVKKWLIEVKERIDAFNTIILEATKNIDDDITFKDKNIFIDVKKFKPNTKALADSIKVLKDLFGSEFNERT